MEFPEYQVGQIVHIVGIPMDGKHGNKECDAAWSSMMDEYCGERAEIVRVADHGRYHIDIDNGRFFWSPDCFQESYGEYVPTPEPDAAEIDAAMESLFEGFAIHHS